MNGIGSGATTSTVRSRARSDAATSIPMKLAPMTTARLARLAPAMMARLSASVRSVWTCGSSAPGSDGRIGSAPVASRSASQATSRPSSSESFLAAGSIAATRDSERQGDLLLAEKRGRTQRHPLLGRGAGQVVLGQVRAIDRRRLVGAEQEDLTVVPFAAQRLGRRLAGRPRADDGDGPQRRFTPQAERIAAPRRQPGSCPRRARRRSRAGD